ncbi:hypothetical protein GC093_19075 [Paenibacillus sp. LMG 31456]|uniref:Uncharacterized protein n=1 Tax=Paenibacillus foliorum TaxID=2654974 RepID=A0A972GWX5_9BACL|nr:hypothetical protein [Paenibacillus foliorum]NOU95312.1 hypothetical protein [Paenibacillus foliorum]
MKEFNRSPIHPAQHQQQLDAENAVDWGSQEWGTHRFQIRQLLENAIDLLTMKDKAAVLGAGNHGDVDLPGLVSQFSQVTVLDTEANSIEEVLEQSGTGISTKIKSLTNVDYTCLDQIQFYETWEDMLLNQAPAGEIVVYLKDSAFAARRHEALPHLKKSFNLVVSSSVHTQLFYIHALSQFASYASQYTEQEISQIIDSLVYLRNSLVLDYNRLLLSLLKPDGKLVMWSEMIRMDEQNEGIFDHLYGLKSDTERMSFLFRAFGQYGIESAVLGLKDLHDQMKQDGQLFKSWVWLPGSEKKFIVAGFSGTPVS